MDPILLQNNQWMCLLTLSCRIWYFDLANTGKPLLRCISVPLSLPHNLHISDTFWSSVLCFIEFTRSACSCTAYSIASVYFLRCPPSTIDMYSLCSFSLYLLRIHHGAVFSATDLFSPLLNICKQHAFFALAKILVQALHFHIHTFFATISPLPRSLVASYNRSIFPLWCRLACMVYIYI